MPPQCAVPAPHSNPGDISTVTGTSRNDDEAPKKLRGQEALSRLSMMRTRIGLCELEPGDDSAAAPDRHLPAGARLRRLPGVHTRQSHPVPGSSCCGMPDHTLQGAAAASIEERPAAGSGSAASFAAASSCAAGGKAGPRVRFLGRCRLSEATLRHALDTSCTYEMHV